MTRTIGKTDCFSVNSAALVLPLSLALRGRALMNSFTPILSSCVRYRDKRDRGCERAGEFGEGFLVAKNLRTKRAGANGVYIVM